VAGNPGFVSHDEREWLLGLFAELVAERGYEEVKLADLAERAGLDLASVQAYFACEEDCALAATDASTAQCFSAVAEAFMSTPGDCPRAAHAALDAMLRFMASVPAFVQLGLADLPRLSPRAAAHRRGYLDQFAEFLGPGFAAAPELPPQPELISQLIAGGIYEIIAKHLVEGRLDQLPDALPAVSFLTVALFFGVEEARRVASLPAPGAAAAAAAER
jgi:AcrR family transcriptional regulator